jgi:hypothetical protein
MNMRALFRKIADRAAGIRRENLPAPDKLARRGILTRESIAWQKARRPQDPALENTPDNPRLRREVAQELGETHEERIAALQERLRGSSSKARRDHRTAHDFGRKGRDQEQER